MLFPTFDFVLFLLPTLVGFWLLARRPVARVLFLLAASYFFYMAGPKTEPLPAPWYFVGLLVFSTLLDFWCGKEIYRREGDLEADDPAVATRARKERNRLLALSLVGNLGLLGYFKYSNFLIEAFSDVASLAGLDVPALRLDLVLPLGISFYTFQSLSYTLDIHKRRLTPETSLRRFALYVVFFPQLVAGPIVRAREFLPQLNRGPRFTTENIEVGAFRVAKGMAKKVVLGDWIAVNFTDLVFDAPGTYTSLELLVALYAYTLQLYADFSGYSDIAIGLARMLGFTIPENFDRPYQARDIAEYWRRWHMTLSSWLRDYLFFPLLARFGAKGGYWALWLTMFLVGMWHGASWNFVIFANMHAGAMVFNRWNRRRKRNAPWPEKTWRWAVRIAAVFAGAALFGRGAMRLDWVDSAVLGGFGIVVLVFVSWLPLKGGRVNGVLHVALTFHYIAISRIFFRAPNLDTARGFVEGLVRFDLLGMRPGLVSPWVWVALAAGTAFHFTPKRWVDEVLLGWFRRTPGVLLGLAFAALAYGLMQLMDGEPRAFVYFQF